MASLTRGILAVALAAWRVAYVVALDEQSSLELL